MKKLAYLFFAGTLFVFAACNSGSGDAAATDSIEEVAACADDCQKACCLGCHATEGEAVCLADHSCCAHHHEADVEEVVEEASEEATEETAE